ncbi:MAG: PfkB family carbohydrate kinase [Enterocloster clostridioformis]
MPICLRTAGIVMTTLEHSSQLLEEISLMARQNNCILIVDPSSKDYSKLSPEIAGRIDILKPNEVETEMLTGVRVETEKDAVQAIHILKEKGIRMPVISLGSRGVVYEYKGRVTYVEGLRVNAADTTAAGDTFIGSMAAKLSQGYSFRESIDYANRAAAYCVQHRGAQISIPLRKMYYNKLYSIFTSQRGERAWDNRRYLLYCDMMTELKLTNQLMNEYDSLPHDYGNAVLYQSEAHLIQCIGQNDGITVTEASKLLKKTKSACSQMVKKLVGKNWVKQTRNQKNNREYKLHLTEEGLIVHDHHENFGPYGLMSTTSKELYNFTDEELQLYIKIQKRMNELIGLDVERSYNYFKTDISCINER